MSRAFVREDGDWYYCIRHKEDCMMADENGKCVLDECRQHPQKDKKERNQKELDNA